MTLRTLLHHVHLFFVDLTLDEAVHERLLDLASKKGILVRAMSQKEKRKARLPGQYVAGTYRPALRLVTLHPKHSRDPFVLAHEIGHATALDIIEKDHAEADADALGRAALLSVLSPIEKEAVAWRLRFLLPEKPPEPDTKLARRVDKILALATSSDNRNERRVAIERLAEMAPLVNEQIAACDPEVVQMMSQRLEKEKNAYCQSIRTERWLAWASLAFLLAVCIRQVRNPEMPVGAFDLLMPLFLFSTVHFSRRIAHDEKWEAPIRSAIGWVIDSWKWVGYLLRKVS